MSTKRNAAVDLYSSLRSTDTWFFAYVPTCAVFLQTVLMMLRGRARSRRRDHSPPPRREVPTPIPGQQTEGGETLPVASPASSWVERCNTHDFLFSIGTLFYFYFFKNELPHNALFLSIAQFPTPNPPLAPHALALLYPLTLHT